MAEDSHFSRNRREKFSQEVYAAVSFIKSPHTALLHPSFSLSSIPVDFLTPHQLSQGAERAEEQKYPRFASTLPATSWVSRADPGSNDLPNPASVRWEFTPPSKQTNPKTLPGLLLLTLPAQPTLGKSSRFPSTAQFSPRRAGKRGRVRS